jgi:hypothetical protein
MVVQPYKVQDEKLVTIAMLKIAKRIPESKVISYIYISQPYHVDNPWVWLLF